MAKRAYIGLKLYLVIFYYPRVFYFSIFRFSTREDIFYFTHGDLFFVNKKLKTQ